MEKAYDKIDSQVYDEEDGVAAFNLSGPGLPPLTLKLSESALLPLYARLVEWMTGLAQRRAPGHRMRYQPAALDVTEVTSPPCLAMDFQLPSGQVLGFVLPPQTLPMLRDAVAILERLQSK